MQLFMMKHFRQKKKNSLKRYLSMKCQVAHPGSLNDELYLEAGKMAEKGLNNVKS